MQSITLWFTEILVQFKYLEKIIAEAHCSKPTLSISSEPSRPSSDFLRQVSPLLQHPLAPSFLLCSRYAVAACSISLCACAVQPGNSSSPCRPPLYSTARPDAERHHLTTS